MPRVRDAQIGVMALLKRMMEFIRRWPSDAPVDATGAST